MRFLSAFLVFFLAIGCTSKNGDSVDVMPSSSHKFSDPTLQQIHDHKDRRESEALHAYLQNADAKYRAEAAFALSSVGDSASFLELHKRFLIEDNAVVQQNIALGIFGCAYAIDSLQAEALYGKALNAEVKQTLLRAFGRQGPNLGPFIKAKLQEAAGDETILLGGIKGYYEQLGTWKKADAYMIEDVVNALSIAEDEEVRIHSAAYLARLRRVPNADLTDHKAQIYALLGGEENPLVKMNVAGALALVKDSMTANVIHDELIKDAQDYRVQVSLLQVADELTFPLIEPTVTAFLTHENAHIQIAAAAYFARYAKASKLDFYKEQLNQVGHWKAKNYLASAVLKAATEESMPEVLQWASQFLANAKSPFARAEFYTILGNSDYSGFLTDFIMKESSDLARTYAVDAWMKTLQQKEALNPIDRAFLEKVVLTGFAKYDDGFWVYTIAHNLNAMREELLSEVAVPDVKAFCANWTLPQHYETRMELEKMQWRKEGKPMADFKLENPYNNPIDWEYVNALSSSPKMVLHTEKGDVTIDMCLENAPASVSYIFSLAEDGFYDGLNFHRVLSNFVAQGGDPEGNGTGSTPKSLRSEWGWEEYSEGTVGIASAGKDTEGCQFFITHNYTPHLSGRYTIIGRVSEGMGVVHQLMVGDVITSVDVVR